VAELERSAIRLREDRDAGDRLAIGVDDAALHRTAVLEDEIFLDCRAGGDIDREAVVRADAVVGVDEDLVAAGVEPGELVVAVLPRAPAPPVRLRARGAAGRARPQTGVGDRCTRLAEHAAADRRARIDLPLEAGHVLVRDFDRIVLVARLIAGAAG